MVGRDPGDELLEQERVPAGELGALSAEGERGVGQLCAYQPVGFVSIQRAQREPRRVFKRQQICDRGSGAVVEQVAPKRDRNQD